MRSVFTACVTSLLLFPPALSTADGQETVVDESAIDAELDAFRADLFRLFNEENYQQMLEDHCHPGILCTWQDGTSSTGHAGVIAEFDKLKQFIRRMQVHPTTDRRLILNEGRVVISSGEMHDDYALARGLTVKLKSRWSATLVKEDDRWSLVSFSVATNAFENEVIDLYVKNAKYSSGALAGIAGLIAGVFATRMLRRRSLVAGQTAG